LKLVAQSQRPSFSSPASLSDLLFRQVSDYRQLIHEALVRLYQQDDPENKAAQADQRPNQYGEETQQRNMSHDVQPDPKNPPRYVEEYALPCVKPDEPVPAVRFHEEEK
jgi:AICAR transformylase/IMP cyclohydrolase PurH